MLIIMMLFGFSYDVTEFCNIIYNDFLTGDHYYSYKVYRYLFCAYIKFLFP